MEKIEKQHHFKKMLSLKEASEISGLSMSYWYKVEIKKFKPTGGKVYISQEDFENWQLQNPVEPFQKSISDLNNFRFRGK